MAKYKSTGLTGKKLVVNKRNASKGKGDPKTKNASDVIDSSEFANEGQIKLRSGKAILIIQNFPITWLKSGQRILL